MNTKRITPYLSILLVSVFLAGSGMSCNKRELDPTGPYKGDTVLYNADRAIIEVNEAMDDIEGLAARNAAAFAQNANLKKLLEKVKKERDGKPEADEVLTNLFRARDAYRKGASVEATTQLEANLNIARAFLEEARAVIASLAAQ